MRSLIDRQNAATKCCILTSDLSREITPRLVQALRQLPVVDFVIEVGRRVFAIEVKAATRWSESDLSGLRAFLERTPACVAAVLAYNGKEAVKLDERLFAIPMGHLIQ